MEWKDWLHCPFKEKSNLPSISGIYVVVDSNNNVWYVGKSTKLNSRWMGRGHHRHAQLIRANGKKNFRIFWHPYTVGELSLMEKHYIELLQPALNGTKVKKYSPGKPQLKIKINQGSGQSEYVYFRGGVECYQDIAEYIGVFPCVPEDEQKVSIERTQLLRRGHAMVMSLKYEIGGKSITTKLLCDYHKFNDAYKTLIGKLYRGGIIVSVWQPRRYYYY